MSAPGSSGVTGRSPGDTAGTERCEGCGALVAPATTPAHEYVGASPGCWALYGEVLAREYSDARFSGVHRLTVDTYSTQHPGREGPRAIRSVAVHLIGLHVTLDLGWDSARAMAAIQAAAEPRDRYVWLDPPWPRGTLTVPDVHRAGGDPAEHHRLVHAWAADVWAAWSPHHGRIREWTALALNSRGRDRSRRP